MLWLCENKSKVETSCFPNRDVEHNLNGKIHIFLNFWLRWFVIQ